MERREDALYGDLKQGLLDEAGYRRQLERVRDERARYMRLVEEANEGIDREHEVTARRVLE